jgi:RNA polymerase sigma-70 factor (ECF subfamily)
VRVIADDFPSGPLSTEALFRRHARFVERFLARLCVDQDQRQDLLQEVFLTVHRHGGYRPGLAKPESYLARVALHAVQSYRRRVRTERARRAEADTEHVPCTAFDPTRAALARQQLQHVHRALERLPAELRATLLRVDLDGDSCTHVADELGVPVGTVYSRLHVARKTLALRLQHLHAA